MEPNQYPQSSAVPKSNPWIVPFSIIVSGALIGAGVYFSSTNPNPTPRGQAIPVIDSVTLREVNADDHLLGDPNAPVIIVEFSDTGCPFCKQFHKTMLQVMDTYGKDGRVAWVYRHFPIVSLHKNAPKEAEASECVADIGGNDKFWQYINAIYDKAGGNNVFDSLALTSLAKEVGIDEEKFSSCLNSGKMKSKVDEDVSDGTIAGVVGPNSGTPYSVLVTRSGQKIVIKGAQPFTTMKAIIDTALAEEPQ
jgi:protein-disulfide isomerase